MKALKNILRVILYGILGILVLFLLLAGFSQTQIFRDRLRAVALDQLDSLLTADVVLGDITGNLVTGFNVHGITLSLRGDTIVHADQLNIRYNLFALPSRSIAVHDITLYHPVIHLRRSGAGLWNIEEMIRPTEEDTSAGAFDWPVSVGHFELRDGTFSITDSVGMREPEGDLAPDAVRYNRLRVQDLNVVLSFQMRDTSYEAALSRFTCTIARTPIRIRQFTGTFHVAPSSVEVMDMRVVTDSSRFALTAGIVGADILGGVEFGQMEKVPTYVDLSIDRLNFHELGSIISQTAFLKGTVDGTLHAEGPFGALQVNPLDLHFGSSHIQVNGAVLNLHNPSNLALNLQIGETEIDPADPLRLLPSFDLPDFSSLGPVSLQGAYRGTPLDFVTRLTASCSAGKLRTDEFALRIGGPRTLQYRGTVHMQGVDLARLLEDPALASNLNGRIAVDGYGVKPARMNAMVNASLDTSTFRHHPVSRAQLQMSARSQKLTGTLGFSIGPTTVHLEGDLDSLNEARPPFAVHGVLESLNLAEFLDDSTYDSDLNCVPGGTGSRNIALHIRRQCGRCILNLPVSRLSAVEREAAA